MHTDPSTSPCSAPRSFGMVAACVRRRLLAQFLTALHAIIPKQFLSSTFIRAESAFDEPVAHSSKMSRWKMAGASAPPCEPAPTRLIAVMRAAISPSLRVKSRLETYFRHELSHLDGSHLFRVYSLIVVRGVASICVRHAPFQNISGNCLRFCHRPNPPVVIEQFCCGLFSRTSAAR